MNSVGNALYCVGGRGSRSNDLGAGRLCLAPLVGGGSWSGPAHGGTRLGGGGAGAGARGGPDDVVSSHCTESVMRGRLDWCGVRWLFQSCCCGVRLGSWTDATWGAVGLRKKHS